MIKPAGLGSSVGMTLVHDASQLDAALDLAFHYDEVALAEAYLSGARDIEVSVIGNDPLACEVYGPGEIVSGNEFYDYAAKYTPGLSETSTRAEVSDDQRALLHKLSRDVYRAIGAEGFARIDFLVDERPGRHLGDQHHPGVHADQPLPDDARRRRLRLHRRLRPDPGAGRGASRGATARPIDRERPAAVIA